MKKNIALLSALLLIASCSKGEYAMDGYYYEKNYEGMAYENSEYPEEEPSGDSFDKIVENPFVSTSEEPVSTFSVDADGAAYSYMRRMILENGYFPDINSVRIEEYLNYFTFDYPDPADGSGVALNAEVGPCPWTPEHRLLRLGIKGKTPETIPQANFVFLIDISGSMYTTDKLPLLKKGLVTMLDYMKPDDRIAIVTYADGEELLLESTPVSEKAKIKKAINKLSAYGSTNGEGGMKMAYEEAEKNFIEGANNRVIMGTDGDFNVGITGTDAICEFVQNYAAKGIYLTICGFGYGNLNDSMMEKVSNSGNGTYEYIDSETEMTKVFVNERARFVSVANDCKTQVTFNPEVVAQYRLIGYENRVLANEDFENDKVDAAEIGMGQTITALYELVLADGVTAAPAGAAQFDFRYKEAIGSTSIPLSLEVPAESASASENLRFASSLACWGLYLRESEYKGAATLAMARELAASSIGTDTYGLRAQYLTILDAAAKIEAKEE